MKDFFYCSQSSLCVILILLVTAFMRIVDVLNTDMGINSCLNFSKSTLLLHLTIQMCVNITVAAGRLLWRGLSWKQRARTPIRATALRRRNSLRYARDEEQ